MAGEVVPTPFDVLGAIARFCPTQKNLSAPAPVVAAPIQAPISPGVVKTVCYHTVGEGDTLWKIARQYKVKVEDLIQINDIENGRLYPGMTLQVP